MLDITKGQREHGEMIFISDCEGGGCEAAKIVQMVNNKHGFQLLSRCARGTGLLFGLNAIFFVRIFYNIVKCKKLTENMAFYFTDLHKFLTLQWHFFRFFKNTVQLISSITWTNTKCNYGSYLCVQLNHMKGTTNISLVMIHCTPAW